MSRLTTAGRMVGDDHKVCTGCGETKPLDAFYRNAGGLAGRQSRCKPCFVQQVYATPGYALRLKARHAVELAIKGGRLVRPPTCSVCNVAAKVHGHHDDYAKPLDIRWLCKSCHDDAHRGQRYEKQREVRP